MGSTDGGSDRGDRAGGAHDVAVLARALVGFIETNAEAEIDNLIHSPSRLHTLTRRALGVDAGAARETLLRLAEALAAAEASPSRTDVIDLREQPGPGADDGATAASSTTTRP